MLHSVTTVLVMFVSLMFVSRYRRFRSPASLSRVAAFLIICLGLRKVVNMPRDYYPFFAFQEFQVMVIYLEIIGQIMLDIHVL